MGAAIVTTAGPSLERGGDLMGILTNLNERDILFVDEIHRLPRVVEELLYPAMEDFTVNFIMDKGLNARTMRIPLRPFTMVGATTRPGMLSSPLRERFGIFHHLDFYSLDELQAIVARSASILGTNVQRLLRRVRDYVQVKGDGVVTAAAAVGALTLEGVDSEGLDRLDTRFLRAIIEQYGGGPVGLEAIAATINDEAETLAEVVEPFLLKIGFLIRTPTGRRATPPAYAHLGISAPAAPGGQGQLPL
jgi:Holliday junction DNA helicase RuvB